MPRIVCFSCGREVYSTAPVEHLFDDERRCPRCGAPLANDRRATDRRGNHGSVLGPDDANPPRGGNPDAEERRKDQRRRGDTGTERRDGGWLE